MYLKTISEMRLKKIVSALLVACLLWSLPLVRPQEAAAAGFSVEISGDGVDSSVVLTEENLAEMDQDKAVYSVINYWPTKKYYVARGVPLMDILNVAGLNGSASIIKITGAGNYVMTFTCQELLWDQHYYYPKLMADDDDINGYVPGSPDGGEGVGAMLALAKVEGSKKTGDLPDKNSVPTLVIGQRYVTEQTNATFVDGVFKIEVLSAAPSQWEMPAADKTGEVTVGTKVTLSTSDMDGDKIYYTTDGSEPTLESPIYNWVAKRWWSSRGGTAGVAKINTPIEVTQDMVIKAKAVGFGKLDSEVATFSYTIKPGGPATGTDIDEETSDDSTEDPDEETDFDKNAADGKDAAKPSVAIGGNNTAYNKQALTVLNKAGEEQINGAKLPDNAPRLNPAEATPVTLKTNDGVQLTVPPGALRNWSADVGFNVALGTITAPPVAEPQTVVLDPLKYQRDFSFDEQTEDSNQFSTPVTVSFPITEADLPEGITFDRLAIYWWSEARQDWVKLGGVYDKETGMMSITTYHFSTFAVMADTGTLPTRLAGFDQFETANAVAGQGWKAGADNVVLVNADSFPDALAAGPLAYKLNAPILLTDAESLTPATNTEIQKLAPKAITLIGGTAVISQEIQDALSAVYGEANVVRYSGIDRYATAAAIAAALGESGKAVLANGEDGHYADALAVSGYAAYNGIPILFTKVSGLPDATAQALADQKVTATIVVGGSAVIPEEVFNQLPEAQRYAGMDCYETATAIATGLRLNLKQVYVVSGLKFQDALVAGNLAAHTLAPIIMVDRELPAATGAFLTVNQAAISGYTVVGGEGIITFEQERAVQDALN